MAADRANDGRHDQRGAICAQLRPAGPGRLAPLTEQGPGRYRVTWVVAHELGRVHFGGGAHLGLKLDVVRQPGGLVPEHERLDQYDYGQRDKDVGGNKPARDAPGPTPQPVQHVCTLPPPNRQRTPPKGEPRSLGWGMCPGRPATDTGWYDSVPGQTSAPVRASALEAISEGQEHPGQAQVAHDGAEDWRCDRKLRRSRNQPVAT